MFILFCAWRNQITLFCLSPQNPNLHHRILILYQYISLPRHRSTIKKVRTTQHSPGSAEKLRGMHCFVVFLIIISFSFFIFGFEGTIPNPLPRNQYVLKIPKRLISKCSPCPNSQGSISFSLFTTHY